MIWKQKTRVGESDVSMDDESSVVQVCSLQMILPSVVLNICITVNRCMVFCAKLIYNMINTEVLGLPVWGPRVEKISDCATTGAIRMAINRLGNKYPTAQC